MVGELNVASDWLRHAESDLALAKVSIEGPILFESLCFHAQQAAEKAIKAVLVRQGIVPPRSHNLGSLVDLLPEECILPDYLAEATLLTDYAVASRYPGVYESVDEAEYLTAVELAEAVLSWAREWVSSV